MFKFKKHAFIFFIIIISLTINAKAAEYFVSKSGNDINNGTTKKQAFLTIQKGVDALNSGDTLTILSGEYFGNIRRENFGSMENKTVIKAEIPGTVLIRGDRLVKNFKKTEGYRFIYETDFPSSDEIQMINELDTLKIFDRMPNLHELEFHPGIFFQDKQSGKVYISTSDMKNTDTHHYSACIVNTYGLYFKNVKQLVIDGLVVTGFNAAKNADKKDLSLYSIWGIFIANGSHCIIRNCKAYLNGQGIGINSTSEESGDNIIEYCTAWSNGSKFGVGDRGGITSIENARDIIRNCKSYLNTDYGINIRGGGTKKSSDIKNQGCLYHNIAWDNGRADLKIKTGRKSLHFSKECVAGYTSNSMNPEYCTFERWNKEYGKDTIVLPDEKDLNLEIEFADPINHDYRLQNNSRFIGKGPDGKDRGAYQYEKNIYYVSQMGNDKNDGLSVRNSWKTLDNALKNINPGDTVYLQTGAYELAEEVNIKAEKDKPVFLLARGKEPVFILGSLNIQNSGFIKFKRIKFQNRIVIKKSTDITFEQCKFNADSCLTAYRSKHLKVKSCIAAGNNFPVMEFYQCKNIDLRSILFDNKKSPAIKIDSLPSVIFSDYNSYSNADTVWQIGENNISFSDLQQNHDKNSKILQPIFKTMDTFKIFDNPFSLPPEMVESFRKIQKIKALANPEAFVTSGIYNKPVGLYKDDKKTEDIYELASQPEVFSLSSTTVNIEWTTSLPAECTIAWGETPECKNKDSLIVNYFTSYSRIDLAPGRTYYFKIIDIMKPAALNDNVVSEKYPVKNKVLSFTTPATDENPVIYYVAPDGDDNNTGTDRQNAFKTIQHAANKTLPGDTVLIAGGIYKERTRIRSTGEKNLPVTFKSVPGEKVILTGAGKKLNSLFIATTKSWINFDGLYTEDTNHKLLQGQLELDFCGDFVLYRCNDIKITRCFSGERNGNSARFVSAINTKNLLIKNCVYLNKMSGGLYLRECPDFVMENSVCARPMISSFVLRNDVNQKATFRKCIFTDMLKKKAIHNIGLFVVDWRMKSPLMENNCYFIRCFKPNERFLIRNLTSSDLTDFVKDPVFADPEFAIKNKIYNDIKKEIEFYPDYIMWKQFNVDFNSFFTKNPELIRQGIGLQEAAFKDLNSTVK